MAKSRFEKMFQEADEAFDGKFKEELNELTGLSKEEIDSVTPDTEDGRTYSKLIKVVEEASRKNMSQAELAEKIKSLGATAIKIAGKVPGLAGLF